MNNSVITLIKFSLTVLLFLAIPFVQGVTIPYIPVSGKGQTSTVAPERSSLYHQSVKKLACKLGKDKNHSIFQKLPAQQIMDVLNEGIFTPALCTWTFKEKELLVKMVSQNSCMQPFDAELKGLVWTLQQCHEIDHINEGDVDFNTTTFFVNRMPMLPGGRCQGRITIEEEEFDSVVGTAFMIHEKIINDMGADVSLCNHGYSKPSTHCMTEMPVYYKKIYDEQKSLFEGHDIHNASMRYVLGKGKIPTLSLLAHALVHWYAHDVENLFWHIVQIWKHSKLSTTQYQYLNKQCENLLAYHRPDLSLNTLNTMQKNILRETLFLNWSRTGLPTTYAEYEWHTLKKEDDASRAQVCMALGLSDDFFEGHCPRIVNILDKHEVSMQERALEKDGLLIASPLYSALMARDAGTVCKLLRRGANPNSARYYDVNKKILYTKDVLYAHPLVLAIVSDQEEAVYALLDAGADVNAPCTITGKLPIEYALENGNENIIAAIKNAKTFDEKMYQQKNTRTKALTHLPTFKKLPDDEDVARDTYLSPLVESTKSQFGQISLILRHYFSCAGTHFSPKMSTFLRVLKQEQQHKEQMAAQTFTDMQHEVALDMRKKRAAKLAKEAKECAKDRKTENEFKKLYKDLMKLTALKNIKAMKDDSETYFEKSKDKLSAKTKQRIEALIKAQEEKRKAAAQQQMIDYYNASEKYQQGFLFA